MKYGDKLYTVDDFIDGDFYTKKRSAKNLTACFFFVCFLFFFSDASTVYNVSAR